MANAQDPCIDYVGMRTWRRDLAFCLALACLWPNATLPPASHAPDAAAADVWPDNWALKTPEFQKSFIESHLKDVATMIKGKPVILEEFGKITEDKAQTVRNKYFTTAHAVAQENAKAGGPLMGTLFWHWCVLGARHHAHRRLTLKRLAGTMKEWAPGNMAVSSLLLASRRLQLTIHARHLAMLAVHKSDSTWELITQNVNFFSALFDQSRSLCPA